MKVEYIQISIEFTSAEDARCMIANINNICQGAKIYYVLLDENIPRMTFLYLIPKDDIEVVRRLLRQENYIRY